VRTDVYERITNAIIAEREQGVRPWHKPWNAEHAAERITRPLRANGIPYRGINILMLWSEGLAKGYAAPIWMTFKQALELNAHVRKGRKARWSSTPPASLAPRRTPTSKDPLDFLHSFRMVCVGLRFIAMHLRMSPGPILL